MNNAINKYGWSTIETKSGFDMFNKKGAKIVTIKIKGSKYAFFDNRNNRLMSGNKNVIEAAIELLTKYYFCEVIK